MSKRSRDLLPVFSGAITGIYATIAWWAVIPNQDLLADGIQVQRVLRNPELVTSFPGQKHGGVIEYLYSIPAEFFAPAEYFTHSAIRVVLAFFTGFLAAKLYRTLFPTSPSWSFLVAVAAGPTVLQGMAGPQSNPVGVYWLTVNYNLAWLLVTLGAWLIARECTRPEDSGRRSWVMIFGGIPLGLGFYQQPTIGILLVPLVFLVIALVPMRPRDVAYALLGSAIGAIPAAINFFFPRTVNTWDPSHFPVINPPLIAANLGLDGMPSYFTALLPYSFGLAPSESQSVGRWQSGLTIAVIAVIAISAVWGVLAALRSRRRLGEGAALATAWLAAIGAIIAFGLVVDPVWFYGAGLAILLWVTIGALPHVIRPKQVGIALTIAAVTIVGGSTLAHNYYWWSELPSRGVEKMEYLDQQRQRAAAIEDLGASFVYGSYYDAIPVAYGSAGLLHPVTNTYNRFPVDASDLRESNAVLVAVSESPGDDVWAIQSLDRVRRDCSPVGSSAESQPFGVFECPVTVLLEPSTP